MVTGHGIEERVAERVLKSLAEINVQPDGGVKAVRREGNPPGRRRGNRFMRPSGQGPGQSSRGQSQTGTCFICNQPGHFRKTCPYKDSCYRCWKKGHSSRDCQAPAPFPLNLQ